MPIPSGPDTAALISFADYQRFTKDTSSVEGDVLDAITIAMGLVDEHCKRHFTYGLYTEALPVSAAGRVYPSATPIETVLDPAGATIEGSALAGIAAGAGLSPSDWPGALERLVTVTYRGGYQPYGATSGPTPPAPVTLARQIAAVAYNVLHPVVLADVPAGVSSVSVGDVSMSSSGGRDLAGLGDAITGAVGKALSGYVKRRGTLPRRSA